MGCGRVGSTLARKPRRPAATPTAVIDTNPDAFRRLGPVVRRHHRHRHGLRPRRPASRPASSTPTRSRRCPAATTPTSSPRAWPASSSRSTTSSPASTTRAAPRSTSGSASPRSRPSRGPPTRCCAASCRPGPSPPGATSPARSALDHVLRAVQLGRAPRRRARGATPDVRVAYLTRLRHGAADRRTPTPSSRRATTSSLFCWSSDCRDGRTRRSPKARRTTDARRDRRSRRRRPLGRPGAHRTTATRCC